MNTALSFPLRLALATLAVLAFATIASAQGEPSIAFLRDGEAGITQDALVLSFDTAIVNRNVPDETVTAYLWYEHETDRSRHVLIDAVADLQNDSLATADARTPATYSVILSSFRAAGSAPNAPLVSLLDGIPAKGRTYRIEIRGLIFYASIDPQAERTKKNLSLKTEIGSDTAKVAGMAIGPIVPYERDRISFDTYGIDEDALQKALSEDPTQIVVRFMFDDADDAIDFNSTASGLGISDPTPEIPMSKIFVAESRHSLPRRPKYKIALAIPSKIVKTLPGWSLPKGEFLEAKKDVSLEPAKIERPNAEFYFESTYTSSVPADNPKRSNVGVFGLTIRPALGFRLLGGSVENPSTTWHAFRPSLVADFDTLPVRSSKGPNRITLGLDSELGHISMSPTSALQQIVWINGVRHDADRDYKTQTVVWRTELVPYFFNFEQTRDQRLYQFRASEAFDRAAVRQPLVTAWRVRPSIGYELGGTVREPDDDVARRVSRLFVRLDTSLEIARYVTIAMDSTYYYVETFDRRPNRAYTEARVDLATGALFNRDLGGLQHGITFKFQRGEQPPTFRPVNVFSIGFRIFR